MSDTLALTCEDAFADASTVSLGCDDVDALGQMDALDGDGTTVMSEFEVSRFMEAYRARVADAPLQKARDREEAEREGARRAEEAASAREAAKVVPPRPIPPVAVFPVLGHQPSALSLGLAPAIKRVDEILQCAALPVEEIREALVRFFGDIRAVYNVSVEMVNRRDGGSQLKLDEEFQSFLRELCCTRTHDEVLTLARGLQSALGRLKGAVERFEVSPPAAYSVEFTSASTLPKDLGATSDFKDDYVWVLVGTKQTGKITAKEARCFIHFLEALIEQFRGCDVGINAKQLHDVWARLIRVANLVPESVCVMDENGLEGRGLALIKDYLLDFLRCPTVPSLQGRVEDAVGYLTHMRNACEVARETLLSRVDDEGLETLPHRSFISDGDTVCANNPDEVLGQMAPELDGNSHEGPITPSLASDRATGDRFLEMMPMADGPIEIEPDDDPFYDLSNHIPEPKQYAGVGRGSDAVERRAPILGGVAAARPFPLQLTGTNLGDCKRVLAVLGTIFALSSLAGAYAWFYGPSQYSSAQTTSDSPPKR